MPNFSVFDGIDLDLDKKLNNKELLRALRFSIAAELEAIQIYDQLAEASDNELFKKVMLDIADEERVHVGEFMKVLFKLSESEKEKYGEGFKEVEDLQRSMQALYKKNSKLAKEVTKAFKKAVLTKLI